MIESHGVCGYRWVPIRYDLVESTADGETQMTATLDGEVADLRRANAELQHRLDERTRERDEALQRETATAEILQLINNSHGDLAPVFDAMLANATRICEAKFGVMYRTEGDALRAVAVHGAGGYAEHRRRNPIIRPSPDTTLGRAAATKQRWSGWNMRCRC